MAEKCGKTFNEKYGSVVEYNISDEVKRNTAKKWRETASQEKNIMQSKYEKFFDDQRVDLDAYVKSLIKELNEGVLDTSYRINWPDYKNCILLTKGPELKRVNTKLYKIIELEN